MGLPERKNHRLKNYDYACNGCYHVTICTKNRAVLLSHIESNVGSDALVAPNVRVIPTELGLNVIDSLHKIETLNENVWIDKFVLMPNHIHAIITINNSGIVELTEKRFDFEISERRGRRSLQGLIKDFKSVTTRVYKKLYSTNESLWQEFFYDERIFNKDIYNKVWKYIDENALKWELDDLYKL